MPLKKNTKTRTGSATTKSRRASVLKDDKVGGKRAPMVTALKENNRCLASALDESRQEYRELQESFLKLQQERQKLLEKIASLESQLLKQDHELLAIHVQPSLQLLNQAEKDIKHAKEYLRRLCGPTTVASSVPEFLSPIRESHYRRKCDDISSCIKFGSEAEVARNENEKPKTVYPKTPHPAAPMKSPQLSSTPAKEDQSSVQSSPILACSPRAIDFEESTLPDKYNKGNYVIARKKKNFEVKRSHEVKTELPTEGSQMGAEFKEDRSTIVSPGLPGGENDRAELDDTHRELNVTELFQRPRRKCSSLNISYQEPSLHSKLRRGDPFTSENTGFLNSENVKSKGYHSTQKAVRGTLTDVTNKK